MPVPKKYHTDEERREGARQSQRKYFKANREAIYARRAKRAKRKQAAIKAGQKVTSASSVREAVEPGVTTPAPSLRGRGTRGRERRE
jgi:hypothetical protein